MRYKVIFIFPSHNPNISDRHVIRYADAESKYQAIKALKLTKDEEPYIVSVEEIKDEKH